MLVGISGGADSTALLAVLASLPQALRPRLVAAHFNHRWRGADADADAVAAADLAARLQVPFTSGSAAGPPAAPGTSKEAIARRHRYAFLGEAARRFGCGCVAVGHQRDDQAETLLLRLARGSGTAGLAAMAPSRLLSEAGDPAPRLVRPLLLASRADVLAFLAAQHLPWREDRSNADQAYARNRVRAHVLPALAAALGPGVGDRIARAAENLRQDADALSLFARDAARRRMSALSLDVGPGWPAEPALRLAILRAWWGMVGPGPALPRDVLRRADGLREGRTLALPGGHAIDRRGPWLVPRPFVAGVEHDAAPAPELPVPGAVAVPGLGEVRATLAGWPDEAVRDGWRAARIAVGDVAGVSLPLRLRPPLPGERLVVLGAPGARRVRGLLAQSGVPAGARGFAWIVADAHDRPLWVVGGRQAASFRVGPGTSSALVLCWTTEASPAPARGRRSALARGCDDAAVPGL